MKEKWELNEVKPGEEVRKIKPLLSSDDSLISIRNHVKHFKAKDRHINEKIVENLSKAYHIAFGEEKNKKEIITLIINFAIDKGGVGNIGKNEWDKFMKECSADK
jgi:hypothetical protein